jgi:acyl phosphate:glycerol-3-phosphate acyltransferase
MQTVVNIGIIILAYLFGAIPFGLVIVKLKTGKDIRDVESGRTGGTNAMRAAGFWAGFATAVLDILKGFGAVWVAQHVTSDQWVYVAAPLAAIIGHNYSIFLPERDENGKFTGLGGGAGGAASVGGTLGLWPISIVIMIPLGALVFFTVGIASITTMAVALFTIIIFAAGASMGYIPWMYVWYGVGAEILLVWALRPNIKKLFEGKERVVSLSLNGWLRARKEKKLDG